MSILDKFAWLVGYVMLSLGSGIAAAEFIGWMCTLLYRRMIDIHSYTKLCAAVREYEEKRKPR